METLSVTLLLPPTGFNHKLHPGATPFRTHPNTAEVRTRGLCPDAMSQTLNFDTTMQFFTQIDAYVQVAQIRLQAQVEKQIRIKKFRNFIRSGYIVAETSGVRCPF